MEQWTIKKLLDWMVDYFGQKNIESPRLTAEMLISFVLNMKRIELYMHFDKIVGSDELTKLRSLVKRCAENEPVQYLVGSCEFYSMTFRVNSDCLIPRPETELLVERAIEFLRQKPGEKKVCDLCTGSGCVAAAIAKGCEDASVIATDISDKALAVAAENIQTHNLSEKVELLCGDLVEPIIDQLDGGKFDLITANPPYVSDAEMGRLDDNVRKYEPSIALAGGADGLDVYKRIVDSAGDHLGPGGALMMEIGYAQGPAVRQILEDGGVFGQIKIEKDFNNNDRVITAVK